MGMLPKLEVKQCCNGFIDPIVDIDCLYNFAVIDYKTGKQIDVVQGEAGFVRGTLRGLAQERKRRGLDSGPPFELIYRADGRLTLSDTATGRLVDLESFGPTNASTFFKLFNASNVVAVSKS